MSKLRSTNFGLSDTKEQIVLADYLPTDKIFKIDQYLRSFGFLSQSIEDYLQGNVRGKLKSPSKKMYGFLVSSLMMFVCLRNLGLAFVDDVSIRNYLGEAVSGRPADQITMLMTLWSIYFAWLSRLYYRGESRRIMSWLTPFAVFKGYISPGSVGLDMPMTDFWFNKTKKTLAKMMVMVGLRAALSSMMLGFVAYRRFKSHSVGQIPLFFWTALLTVWMFYGTALIYISYGYFNSMATYFRMRYRKVNNDIEAIIAPDNRLKPNERCAMLHHILVEHNELCIKISDYNTFWSKYIMQSYFMFIAVICYTTFQAFFTYNTYTVRTVMFAATLEGAYILTKVSISASRLANEAHSSYGRLIRVTFDKYPVELQIQLRMFIQRLSGPTIGFYCSNIFEITYSTYASIIAALGQNFLLIIDFVRSYAELKEEHYTSSELDITDVFNTSFDLNPLAMSNDLVNALPDSLVN